MPAFPHKYSRKLSSKLLRLSISHDLSWANIISNLASKASRQLGILHHTKSFLGTPELLSTYRAFIHSWIEYCFPLWTGAPASHYVQLDAVETKTLKIIGIACDEAESIGLSLRHH